jgi:hypothetical protein
MVLLGQLLQQVYQQQDNGLGGAGTQPAALGFGGYTGTANTACNRRMDRCRSSCYKNNYSKLTGGKYGNKNIHRS